MPAAERIAVVILTRGFPRKGAEGPRVLIGALACKPEYRSQMRSNLMRRTIEIARLAVIAVVLLMTVAFPATAVWAAQNAEGKSFFLVARPEMNDPLFGESVILMLPRSTRYPLTVGLIINKPTKVPLQRLFARSPLLGNRSDTAYFGGPVDINSPVIVFRADQASGKVVQVGDHVYMSLDPDYVSGLMQGGEPIQDFRLYLGRSQWAPGQLRQEMLDRSWYVVKAETSIVFSSNPGGVWHALVQRAQLLPAMTSGPEPDRCLFFPCGEY